MLTMDVPIKLGRALLYLGAVVAVVAGCATSPDPQPQPKEPTAEPSTLPTEEPPVIYESSAARLISPADAKRDLEFVKRSLLDIHPALIDGFSSDQLDVLAEIDSAIADPLPYAALLSQLNKLLQTIGDRHTTLALHEELRGPRLPLVWLDSGLFAYADVDQPDAGSAFADHLQAGDELISISGVPVGALVKTVENALLVTGTRQDTRALPPDLLFSDAVRVLLGLAPGAVAVSAEVLRDGALVDITIDRMTPMGQPAPYAFEPPTYRLAPGSRHVFPRQAGALGAPQVRVLADHSVGYLRFDHCRLNPEYRTALKELFTATTMERLSAVVVDLRFNRGGDSRVTQAFLRYLGVREYPTFTRITRYSPQAAEQRGYHRTGGIDTVPNPVERIEPLKYPSLVFNGRVYILVSNHTASSANWFASIVKQNGFGLVVGEPTGSAPAGYGDIILLATPALQIPFSVSHKQFITPAGDDGTYYRSVPPDIIVPTTITDVLTGFDAQMAYVLERARRGR
jgi:hypothetical protein